MNISFIFRIFKDFSSGSVWELYLLSVMILIALFCNFMSPGVEFRQKIYLSDGQVDLQNHLSVMKSTCPTQENHKIKRLFNVAP